MTPTQAAYLAGLLDGEGSIVLFVNTPPSAPNGRTLARMAIAMCDKAPIVWAHKVTNCGTLSSWQSSARWKVIHKVTWHGKDAVHVLSFIGKYLKVKQRQAALLRRWVTLSIRTQTRLLKQPRHQRRFQQDILAIRDECVREMSRLNHRGNPQLSN